MELTATDICKIIKSCRDHSVRVFEYGNLKVRFTNQLVDVAQPAPHPSVEKPIPEEVDKAHREEEEFLLSETVIAKEEQIATLLVEEPEKYEALAFSGDLVDAKSDNSGS